MISRERGKQEQRANACWAWIDSWLVNCQTKGLLECWNPSWCGRWKPWAKLSTLWNLFSDGLWIWFAGEVWCSHQTSKAFQVQNLMGSLFLLSARLCTVSKRKTRVYWYSMRIDHTKTLGSSLWPSILTSVSDWSARNFHRRAGFVKWDDISQLCNAICPRKDDGLAMGWLAAQHDPKKRWSIIKSKDWAVTLDQLFFKLVSSFGDGRSINHGTRFLSVHAESNGRGERFEGKILGGKENLFSVPWGGRVQSPPPSHKSYLVDPASSHMLVSKIKPCMSKYKQLCTVKLRMAH